MAVAGDWIPMRHGLDRERETLIVAARLSIRPDFATGLMLRFWCWASDTTTDGFLSGMTFETIDQSVVGYEGFCEAMSVAGWLVQKSNGVRIPNFDHWMSANAKARLGEAKRKRLQRAKLEQVPDPGQRPRNVRTNMGLREQDSREEKPPSGVYIAGPPNLPPVISEDDAAAVALSRWAQSSRGFPLTASRGEFEAVGRFLVSMAAEPPIVHGGVSTARGLLIPKAADIHRERGTPFKSIKWALTCVQNLLAEWAATGVVGQKAPKAAEPAFYDPFPKEAV